MRTKLRYAHVANSNVGAVKETSTAHSVLSIGARPLTKRERYAAENGGDQELSGRLTEGDLVALLAAIEQTSWVQWVKAQMAADAPAGEPGGEVVEPYARRYATSGRNQDRAAIAREARGYAERHPGCTYEQALDELKFAQPTA